MMSIFKNKYVFFLLFAILLCVLVQCIKYPMVEGFDDNMYNHNICGKTPPFPNLGIFTNNISSPTCCGTSSYSTSTGCLCLCQEQKDYLLKRGGNIS